MERIVPYDAPSYHAAVRTKSSAREISRRTDVAENSIHPVLARLEDRELVRHKGPYWAITDDLDRLRRAYDTHRATRLFDDLYGEEDRDEWVEADERADE